MTGSNQQQQGLEHHQSEAANLVKVSDLRFISSVEHHWIMYKTDMGLGWAGSAVFFNNKLYAIHSQPPKKRNSDEAVIVAFMLEFINSPRTGAITSILRGAHGSMESAAVQIEAMKTLSFYSVKDDHIYVEQLVRYEH